MNFKIAVLPGDGIGPEISAQGVLVMKKVCERSDILSNSPTVSSVLMPSIRSGIRSPIRHMNCVATAMLYCSLP